MTLSEVRARYLAFFAARGHKIIPSAPLVPENDPTTLFTSSGMQPLVPYLLGQSHPEGTRVADAQKSFRADDIDEVGDNRHTTFFEMLGNWSFGDYFKTEQLSWAFAFLTDEKDGVGLNPMNIYVTVFAGDAEMEIPADDDAIKIWKELFAGKDIDAKYVALGSEENGAAMGMQGGRIFSYDVKKNWWSRAGVPSKMPPGEPGGPDSELFYDFGETDEGGVPRHAAKFGAQCHPNCDCGRFLEIGNNVFMEYKKREDGRFEKMAQRNVDFGGGLERIVAAANGDADIFKIDIFEKMYAALDFESAQAAATLKEVRIILDHTRAAIFLIGDGIRPSNKVQGYILRRLLRRTALFGRSIFGPSAYREKILALVPIVADYYGDYYKNIKDDAAIIAAEMENEFKKFDTVVEGGLKEIKKILAGGTISGTDAFNLLQTHGFPWELTQEMAEKEGIAVDRVAFEAEFQKHRDLSRTASAGTFKGGLADTSEKTVRLHTAHHLLLRALQTVLGPAVKQRGSNITAERLRMDFNYDAKMTDDQKAAVEKIVNEKIAEDLPVIRSEMPREEAEGLGAEHEFGAKYPERVSVYSVGPKDATLAEPKFAEAFSIEFCGGPHVACTGVIGHFKIAKEEASSAGIRRIRGVIDNG